MSTFFQPKFEKPRESHQRTFKNVDKSSAINVECSMKSYWETLDTFITISYIAKAELISSLKSVINRFSNWVNDELSETFAAMFPDRKIVRHWKTPETWKYWVGV